jgi:hypothetical protein
MYTQKCLVIWEQLAAAINGTVANGNDEAKATTDAQMTVLFCPEQIEV